MVHWPHERSLVKKLQGKPFALIGVDILKHTPASLKKVMAEQNITWRTFADDGTIAKKWNFPPTPAFYVLDGKGVIRHKWIGHPGEKTIDEALDKLIREVQTKKN